MFMSDISIIVRKMRTHAERNQAQLGIAFPEQLVIMHLKANGASKQEAIAASLDIDKGAIAKTVAKLEEKGLVTRQVNPKSKREKLVTLQPGADQVIADMQKSYVGLEEMMFAGLSDEDRRVMERCIGQVARNVSEV